MNFKNMNESAVSPIVATLVLIVVAVVGAVAVGTIMGAFSSDVSEQMNPGDVAGASAAEILIAGSTTVQPVSELLAEAYMNAKPGVKITVQGGGSGTGVTSVGMDIVDIGSASRAVKDAELEKYPSLQTYQIGGSAVVLICSDDLTLENVTQADIKEAYANYTFGTSLPDVTKAFARAESSGTQDTFLEWLDKIEVNASVQGKTGNAGVLAAVADATDAIGFVDFGYADGADGVNIVDLEGYDPATSDTIGDALAGQDTYPNGLTRPLNYIVNGNPSAIEKDFINFAKSPGAVDLFNDVGMFSIIEFA
nr:substrate-binding domain-containing protein [Methanoculleus marisnigri]